MYVTDNDYHKLFVEDVSHILSDLQLDEPVYNKAEPDTFSWDRRQ